MLTTGLQKSKAGALEVPSSCCSSMKVRSTHCSIFPRPFRGYLIHDPSMH